ncbi:MAG: hypothetical protein KGM42_01915 [Hyphomicrobiales bacterium]|nr:hypothetical protein [Hyphomicrobiales bacterium]
MLKATVASSPKGKIVLVDSITKVAPEDKGAHVLSASHGGASSGEFALEVPLASAFFNDAGVGKDKAGISALDMLQARGVAAGTISHETGRIGDSQDMWDNGVISHANALAIAAGLKPGLRIKDALLALVG